MLYKKAPKGFKPTFEAAGCFVECQNRVLHLLRAPHVKIEPSKWGTPAGKIEKGETPKKAMVRELFEEAGIAVLARDLQFVAKVFCDFHPQYDFSYSYSVFKLVLPKSPKIVLSEEHVGWAWTLPQDAGSLRLFKDERRCIKIIYGL